MTEEQKHVLRCIDRTINWLTRGEDICIGRYAAGPFGEWVSPVDTRAVKWCPMGRLIMEVRKTNSISYGGYGGVTGFVSCVVGIFNLNAEQERTLTGMIDRVIYLNDKGAMVGKEMSSLRNYLDDIASVQGES